MALENWYSAGTVSVESGSTTVTLSGGFWGGDAIMAGDFLVIPSISSDQIAVGSVTSPTELELLWAWPHTDAEDAPYFIFYTGIIERSTAQTRKVLEQLGDVKAWYDVIVEDDDARLALETEGNPLPAKRRVLVKDDGVIWQKQTSAYGDWIGPVEFKGDTGNKGWTPQYAAVEDGDRVVFQLAGWVGGEGTSPDDDVGKYLGADGFVEAIEDAVDIRGLGFNFRGAYSGSTAYAKGDVVRDNGSSWVALGTTIGNAPPVYPTSSNDDWDLFAVKGQDGTGTGDVVGPTGATDGRLAAADGSTGKLIKFLTAEQATAAINAVAGDSGSGGTKGLVPAPAAGDAAANKFLKADGTWTAIGGGTYRFLLISDSQPQLYPSGGTIDAFGHVAKWRSICSGIAARHPGIERGFFCGDLVDRGEKGGGSAVDYYDFEDWIEDIQSTGVPLASWDFLAGNHDFNFTGGPNAGALDRTFAEYLSYFYGPRRTTRVGNILHVSLSTEDASLADGSQVNWIRDETLEWLDALCDIYRNTGVSIILHIHHGIEDTTVGTDVAETWHQHRSQRFIDIFEKPDCPIVLVTHGHTDHGLSQKPVGGHIGGLTDPDIVSHIQKHGPAGAATIWHVNVGLHIPSYMEPSGNTADAPMSYCTAEVTPGSNTLTVRRWNVETGDEVVEKLFTVNLIAPFSRNEFAEDRRIEALLAQQKGSFLPYVGFSVNGTMSPTFSGAQMGQWERYGDIVHTAIDVMFDVNAYTGASGYFRVFGLPFKMSGLVNVAMTIGRIENVSVVTWAQITAFMTGAHEIAMRNMSNNNASGLISTGNIVPSKTGVRLIISGSYRIAGGNL